MATTVEWVPASAAELTERRRRVRTADDLEIDFWYLNRYVDFESRRTPVESAKAKLRSLPTLVEQLNGIAGEAKDRAPRRRAPTGSETRCRFP